MFPHLSKLDLADIEGESDIDVLVGFDHYWRLVMGRVIRGENCSTAIETVFGWVVRTCGFGSRSICLDFHSHAEDCITLTSL